MERQIEEKYVPMRRSAFAFLGIPFGLSVLGMLAMRDLRGLATVAGAWVFASLGVLVLLWIAAGSHPVWFVNEGGLRRTRPSGEEVAVPWDQITDMRWVGVLGLVIRWNKIRPDSTPMDVRSTLGIEEHLARELITSWRKHGNR
jgi:hypothetical protein